MESVRVIGAGLAGSEAALTLADRGVHVILHEMKPEEMTPAHGFEGMAELVCSNSFKSMDENSAAGVLKRTLRMLGSHLIRIADECAVPAGGALAVDREEFSRAVTAALSAHPDITIEHGRVDALPEEGRVIVATGPLTTDTLASELLELVGGTSLSFFDAAAPIVTASSLDRDIIFAQSRYDKGSGRDYLNAPLTKEQYEELVEELVDAERVELREFERRELFAACQPVEEVARSGPGSLRFGALKPVGLTAPDGTKPFAVVQLRAENRDATAYNLVGFQTNLTFPEQRRIFSRIPGLQNAEFVRYGVMHRNTYLDAPRVLDRTFALRVDPRIRIAGQLTGTEGYTEAVATGLLAGLNTYAEAAELEPLILPDETVLGALLGYATDPETEPYQPMHVNYGIIPPLEDPVRKKRERYAAYSARDERLVRDVVSERADLIGNGIDHGWVRRDA